MGTKAETMIVRNIIRAIQAKGGVAVHITGGSKQMRGLPDILGGVSNHKGVMTPFFIEIKTEAGELSPLQEVQLALWKRVGFKTGVARNINDVLNIVDGD